MRFAVTLVSVRTPFISGLTNMPCLLIVWDLRKFRKDDVDKWVKAGGAISPVEKSDNKKQ